MLNNITTQPDLVLVHTRQPECAQRKPVNKLPNSAHKILCSWTIVCTNELGWPNAKQYTGDPLFMGPRVHNRIEVAKCLTVEIDTY